MFKRNNAQIGTVILFSALALTGCNENFFSEIPATSNKLTSAPPGGGPNPSPNPNPSSSPNPLPTSGLPPVTQVFDVTQTSTQTTSVPAPVDILWVIDNSGSMAGDQAKLATGISKFAQKYLVPNRDIRMAAITTDTYLSGMTAPSAASFQCGTVDNANFTYSADYSRLFAGVNDGPRPFLNEMPRSGKAILSSVPPQNVDAAAWLNQMITDFKINAKPGTKGNGSERGLQSIVKMLSDNEKRTGCQGLNPDASCFFRKNAVRAIAIISDEEDGSSFPGSPNPSSLTDSSHQTYNVSYGKKEIDDFFKALDGSQDPKYLVAAIANRTNDACSNVCNCNRGKKYEMLVNAVKADSSNSVASASSLGNIADTNYDTILDQIGLVIQNSTTTVTVITGFMLSSQPANPAAIEATLVYPNGSEQVIASNYISVVNGNQLQISGIDPNSIPSGTKLRVKYQPM